MRVDNNFFVGISSAFSLFSIYSMSLCPNLKYTLNKQTRITTRSFIGDVAASEAQIVVIRFAGKRNLQLQLFSFDIFS